MTKPSSAATDLCEPNAPQGAVQACWIFTFRSLLKIRHIPEQLIDSLAMPIITTVLFTYLFGGALSASPVEYLQYFLPGVLTMSVLMLTMYTGMEISKDLSTGSFDRFRAMDIWRPAPLVGQLLSDTLRYLLTAVIIIFVGLALGYRPTGSIGSILGMVATVIFFAFSVSWIWLLLGIRMRNERSVMAASMSGTLPMVFISNIFLDPNTMPTWLQVIVKANPITYVVSSARYLSSGNGITSEFWMAIVFCAALILIVAPLTIRAYSRS